MGNCLVTKLKENVNNPNLIEIDEVALNLQITGFSGNSGMLLYINGSSDVKLKGGYIMKDGVPTREFNLSGYLSNEDITKDGDIFTINVLDKSKLSGLNDSGVTVSSNKILSTRDLIYSNISVIVTGKFFKTMNFSDILYWKNISQYQSYNYFGEKDVNELKTLCENHSQRHNLSATNLITNGWGHHILNGTEFDESIAFSSLFYKENATKIAYVFGNNNIRNDSEIVSRGTKIYAYGYTAEEKAVWTNAGITVVDC